MNALAPILAKLGLALLSALDVQRVVAMLLNRLLDKVSPANIEKARKTSEHLAELSTLFADILDDKTVSGDEVNRLQAAVIAARARLLDTWADGRDGKATQVALGNIGVSAEYVDTPATVFDTPQKETDHEKR